MIQKTKLTTRCSQYQHPEFRVAYDSTIVQGDVDTLVSWLEESVAQETRFKVWETIAFGSMLLRVAAMDGDLALEEPDLQSFPIEWTLGVTQSIKLMRLQKDIVESVGLDGELDFAEIRSSLLVGTDLANDTEAFFLERAERVGSDSGWFIGSLETELDYNDPANLDRLSVYRAILDWPQVAGFLGLPADCRVEVTGSTLLVSRSGEPLEIKKGSLLDCAMHRSG